MRDRSAVYRRQPPCPLALSLTPTCGRRRVAAGEFRARRTLRREVVPGDIAEDGVKTVTVFAEGVQSLVEGRDIALQSLMHHLPAAQLEHLLRIAATGLPMLLPNVVDPVQIVRKAKPRRVGTSCDGVRDPVVVPRIGRATSLRATPSFATRLASQSGNQK